ncbi:hypothetical protein FRC16_004601 [Serendipita sp. 398]|nr:hypothetical protein FRC16_004601 [Serendipita sp. 398]
MCPYLMICGAIYHENAHIEPLTPLLPMFPEIGIEGRPAKIAHCLRALKEGLDAIQEFWQRAGILDNTNRKATTDKLSEPYLVFDCPDNDLLRFEEWQGTFESLMPDRNKIEKPPTDESPRFLAKIHKAGDKHQYQVVVKFVYNHSGVYGTDVHQYLSDNELAPTLHWTKNLHRGLVMVVMKHLQLEKDIGGWVELDAFKGKLGTRASAVRKELEKIIRLLQAKRMVHADLRPKNIMVKVDGNGDIITGTEEPFLSVIDFDWSGTVGEVCYPPFLNSRIRWPEGAKAYQKIGEKDDSILLENWWDAFEKGQPANEKGEPAKFDASS